MIQATWYFDVISPFAYMQAMRFNDLPDDVNSFETAGTELAPNGVEGEGKIITTWKTGHWMIYPGKVWHRPGVVQSMEDRYIVAADLEF